MSAELRLLLRDLRQAQELSQDELAHQLGISRQSIISLEQGAYLPSFPLLINMIQFFNCDLEELVEGLSQNVAQLPSVAELAIQSIEQPATRPAAGAINVYETAIEYEVQVQAPGFKENEIHLEFSGDTLTITAQTSIDQREAAEKLIRREWECDSFTRQVRFAHPIDVDQVEAKLADGMLTIHTPKVEPVKPKIKKIEVKK
ncbi:MAG: Hsp20 family protein [Candidatus Berkelbacteria bacterium]|nr:Hsp20 family protein [Candidatus Berkelbacteria bacterium]MCR4307947.1 Hsp20 family protein [Candidatus Berkelbacteria bacterium]